MKTRNRKGIRMPGHMPNRFDIVYAHLKEKGKPDEDAIGYVMDIREDERKSAKVSRNDGLPAYTPKNYTIKFLNRSPKDYPEDKVHEAVSNGEWKVCRPRAIPNLDKPRYGIGDLVFNRKNQKVSLIISLADFGGHEDFSTKTHSQFWYKVQSPGQRWEPMSETFIENAKEEGFVEVHRKRSETQDTPITNE